MRGHRAAAAGGRVDHFGGVGPIGGVAVQVGDVPGLAHHAGVADFGAVRIHLHHFVGAQGGADGARDQAARAGVCGQPVGVVTRQGAAVLGHGAESHRLGDDVAHHKVNGVDGGQARCVGARHGHRGGARSSGRAAEGAGGGVEADARRQCGNAVGGGLAVGGAVHVGKVAGNAEAADGGADQQAGFVGLCHHQGGRVVGAFDGNHQVGGLGTGAVVGGVGEDFGQRVAGGAQALHGGVGVVHGVGVGAVRAQHQSAVLACNAGACGAGAACCNSRSRGI